MKEMRKWAMLLPALLILAFGFKSLLNRYPMAAGRSPGGRGDAALRDTALPPALLASVSLTDTVADADTAPVPDPFRLAAPTAWKPSLGAGNKPPLIRRWKLRGTTGDAVATLIDSLGAKHLLRVGESLAGARLVEVHANHVMMQDAAGPFELDLEP